METLTSAHADYGDVVRFRVGLWDAYVLTHPSDVKHLLQDNYQNYRKGFTFGHLKSLVGSGLLTAEGDSWRIQRRLAQPAFHRQRLAACVDLIAEATQDLCDRWHQGTTGILDLDQEMTAMTLQIVSKAILGVDLDGAPAEIGAAMGVAQEHINWHITHLFSMPEQFPTPRNLRFKRSLRVLDEAVFSMIERKRLHFGRDDAGDFDGHRGDVLSQFLAAQESGSDVIPDLLLRDEVMTFLMAGYETTANALTWCFYYLTLNPEVEERLHAEVDAVLGGRNPTAADLPNLKFTRMVFDETLRLRPPVWALGRFCLADDEAGGYRIPAYSSVLLSPYVTHRHPEFWEQPERFDPDRFQPAQVASRPAHAFVPFGAGPRMCIGAEFAMMEAVVCLAIIAGQFRIRLVPDTTIEPEPLITLRPKGGMPVHVQERP